jgi:hypothetical protein
MRADYHRLDRVALDWFGILAVTVLTATCGGSGGATTPSQPHSLTVIKERFQRAFGVSIDDVEREWLAMLR